MQTYLERPRNIRNSLMPANFEHLEGWTIDELHHEINRRLQSGQWKTTKEALARRTIYTWERITGHRLDRFCCVCEGRKRADEMRKGQTQTCRTCTPKAERRAQQRERTLEREALRNNRFGHTHESLERDIENFIAGGGTITVGPPPVDPRHPATAETFGTLRYRRPD